MANWTEMWRPQSITPYGGSLRYRTLITPFESGKEQRRQKWSKEKHRFVLNWNMLSKSTFYEIQEFFKARKGAYESFYFPNYSQYIKGTRLSLNVSTDVITDSGGDFLNFGFDENYDVCLAESAEGNDGYYSVRTGGVDDNVIELSDALPGNDESANPHLIIYKVYLVRFLEDTFSAVQINPDYYRLSVEVIEVF